MQNATVEAGPALSGAAGALGGALACSADGALPSCPILGPGNHVHGVKVGTSV